MSGDPDKTPSPQTEPERLPVTLGQIGMWIFISTEVMFFAALITTALIARLSIEGTVWPVADTLHLSLGLAMVNTMLLVMSGISVFSAVKAAMFNQSGRARCLLLVTILLGAAFLVIKGTEYWSKYQLGLISLSGQKQMFEKANREYVSAVDQQLQQEIDRLEQPGRADSSGELKKRLDDLYELQSWMSGYTARAVGLEDNRRRRELLMRLMAYQVYKHPDSSLGVDDLVLVDKFNLEERQQQFTDRLAVARRRITEMDAQIEELSNSVNEAGILGQSEQASESGLLLPDNWLATKETQRTRLAVEIENLQLALRPVDGRLNVLYFLADPDFEEGFNYALGLRLPVVITNGNAWMSNYLLLTGVHSLHLLAGLVVLLWFLPRRLDHDQASRLMVAGMYWQFVDVVWLVIFFVVYF